MRVCFPPRGQHGVAPAGDLHVAGSRAGDEVSEECPWCRRRCPQHGFEFRDVGCQGDGVEKARAKAKTGADVLGLVGSPDGREGWEGDGQAADVDFVCKGGGVDCCFEGLHYGDRFSGRFFGKHEDALELPAFCWIGLVGDEGSCVVVAWGAGFGDAREEGVE